MDTTGARAFAAEGARVGIMTCLECGAALFIDPTDKVSAIDLHDEWHKAQTTPTEEERYE